MLQAPAYFDDVTSSSQTVKNILLPTQCALPWARQRPWGRVGHTVGPVRELLGGLLKVRGPPEEPPWRYLEVAAGPAAAKNDSGRRLSIPLPWRQSSASGSTWRHLGAFFGSPRDRGIHGGRITGALGASQAAQPLRQGALGSLGGPPPSRQGVVMGHFGVILRQTWGLLEAPPGASWCRLGAPLEPSRGPLRAL